MTFTGLLADINEALDGLVYDSNQNFNGTATLTINTNDLGNTGAPGALSDNDVVDIIVNPINDPPLNSINGSGISEQEAAVPDSTDQVIDEDTLLTFNTANSNLLSISDVDVNEGTGILEVQITVTDGVFSLNAAEIGDLTFTVGDGTADATMTFTGLLADINEALDGLVYDSDPNFNGTATLTINTNDLGNTGAPGALSDNDVVDIIINPINDPPLNEFNDITADNAPDPVGTIDEDTTLTFDEQNPGGDPNITDHLSIDDPNDPEVDPDVDIYTTQLQVANGIVTLVDGSLITAGANGTNDLTLTGTLNQINAALDDLVFTPDQNFNDNLGQASITMTTTDSGGANDIDTVNIDVTPVNDPPLNEFNDITADNAPDPVATIDEDTTLTFDEQNPGGDPNITDHLSIDDPNDPEVDPDVDIYTTQLQVANGIVTLPDGTLITAGANGTNDLTLTGTLNQINAALDDLVFTPDQDFNDTQGQASITMTTTDSGGANDVDTLNINVTPVNDPPLNEFNDITADNAPDPVATIDEDTTLTFDEQNPGGDPNITDHLSIDDPNDPEVDPDVDIYTTQLQVANGIVTLVDGSLITAGANGTNDLTLTGTINQINAALDDLVFTPDQNFNDNLGQASITMTTTDSGGANDVDTVSINVTPVNDPPLNEFDDITADNAPDPVATIDEDTTLTFDEQNPGGDPNITDHISIDDPNDPEVDPDVDIYTTQLQVANGIVTLVDGSLITAGANGTNDLTLTGTLNQINAALDDLVFTPDQDFNDTQGQASITMTTTDSGGANDVDTLNINVTPVNDPPLNEFNDITADNAPDPVATIDEDTTLTFDEQNPGGDPNITDHLSIDDPNDPEVDPDVDIYTTQLQVANGIVTLPDGTLITAGANGTNDLTLTGTINQINAALDDLVFTPNQNFNDNLGQASITMTTTDSGGANDVDTVNINVTPVNDPPLNEFDDITADNAPDPVATIDEDTTLTFDEQNPGGDPNITDHISIDDPNDPEVDPDVDIYTTQLQVANGIVTLPDGTLITAGANGTNDLTLTGTLNQINAALDDLVFTPDQDFNDTQGQASITITTTDSGGANDVDTLNINVNPVNDPPLNEFNDITADNAPDPVATIDEDTTLTFDEQNPGGDPNITDHLSIDDPNDPEVDPDVDIYTTQLQVANGIVTLVDGSLITAGANGTDDLTLTGTINQINAALDDLVFTPDQNFNDNLGQASITMTTTDSGGANDVDTVNINVTPVNDPPLNEFDDITADNAPDPVATIDEDTTLTFDEQNPGGDPNITDHISIDDPNDPEVDPDVDIYTTQLQVANGIVTLPDGTLITAGANGTNDLTLTGTLNQINAVLDDLVFTPDQDFNDTQGQASITITTTDSGGANDVDTLNINVNPVNDPPLNEFNDITADNAPDPVATIDEDTTLTFDEQNPGGDPNITDHLSIDDPNDPEVDPDVDIYTTQLQVANGIVTLVDGSLITAGANGTDDLTLTGTINQINAALDDLVFTPDQDFNDNLGQASITMTTTDSGGANDIDTVNINVTPLNDPPLNEFDDITADSAPDPVATIDQDTTLAFDSQNPGGDPNVTDHISIDDPNDPEVDPDVDIYTTQLQAANGIVTLVNGSLITAGSNGSTDLTLTGTLNQINAALDDLVFTPDAGFNDTLGQASITMTTTDSGGANDVDTLNISVLFANNPPLNEFNDITADNAPDPVATIDEDTTLTFDEQNPGGNPNITDHLSIDDPNDLGVDPDVDIYTTQLQATNGTITLPDGTLITAGANGTDDLTLTGTINQINAALDDLVYTPDPDFNGQGSITMTTTDAGGASDTDTLNINMNPVNDPPLNEFNDITADNAPDPVGTIDEDTTLTFDEQNPGGDPNITDAISIDDPDDTGIEVYTVQLVSTDGIITLPDGSLITAGANGTDDLTLTGTLAQINAALDDLLYTPDPDFNGQGTITITTTDDNSATDVDTLNIDITPVDDDPINLFNDITADNAPDPVGTIDEDTTLTFDEQNPGGDPNITDHISIDDPDDTGVEVYTTQLQVTDGIITLPDGTLITAGSNGSGDLTLTGTLAQINAALDDLVFTPDQDFNGQATITVTTTDPDSNNDVDVLNIDINGTNDDPTIDPIPDKVMNEDGFLDPDNDLEITDIVINDPDDEESGGDLLVTISVNNGILTLDDITGLAFTGGTNNGEATISFLGTEAEINAVIDTLNYAPDLNFNGVDTVTITVNDQGNSGTGGGTNVVETFDITVNPVNDAPDVIVPPDLTGGSAVNEDDTVVFSSINTTDVDVNRNVEIFDFTLDSTNGTMALGNPSLVANLSGDGTNSITFEATLQDAQDALNGLAFTPTPNFFGFATITITADDRGQIGILNPADGTSDTEVITMEFLPINDPPVIVAPDPVIGLEDTPIVFDSGTPEEISTTDPEGDNPLTVTLTVKNSNGTITLGNPGLVMFTVGTGTGDLTMTFFGSEANVNAAMDGMFFTPNPGYTSNDGPEALCIVVDDGTDTATEVTNIIVVPNQPPTVTVPLGISGPQDTPFVVEGPTNIPIITGDPDSPILTVTLISTDGTLTLDPTGIVDDSADPDGDYTTTFTGTLAQINEALSGMIFNPDPGFTGPTTVLVLVSDGALSAPPTTALINVLSPQQNLAEPDEIDDEEDIFAPPRIFEAHIFIKKIETPIQDIPSHPTYGFYDVEGVNQITSFGENYGYEGLADQGNAVGGLIENEPALANHARSTGFHTNTKPVNHILNIFNSDSNKAEVGGLIDKLGGTTQDSIKANESQQIEDPRTPPLYEKLILKSIHSLRYW